AANQEVKKDESSLRYIVLPNWAHDALLESTSSKPYKESNTQVPKGSGNPNTTASSSNPLADQMGTLTVESPIPTVSSPVPTACLNDFPKPYSEARLISKRATNQEETPSLDNILSLTNRFEDILGVSTSSDETIGVEADVSNMKTSISASPTPTLRIHKDHPKTDQMGTLTVESPIPTVSSPVPTACLNDSPEPFSKARLISKRVVNQEETPSLDNILSLTNRFEDILGVTTSSDETIGVEADVSNMETSISASPTPTLRIHKDHPKSQIIGLVDTQIQTRHKSKMMEEQSFIATIHQKTNPDLLQFRMKEELLSEIRPG
nr:hypothetical protein [Tanacetum cinerariifolium]